MYIFDFWINIFGCKKWSKELSCYRELWSIHWLSTCVWWLEDESVCCQRFKCPHHTVIWRVDSKQELYLTSLHNTILLTWGLDKAEFRLSEVTSGWTLQQWWFTSNWETPPPMFPLVRNVYLASIGENWVDDANIEILSPYLQHAK